MQVTPGHESGWRVSPAIPLVANGALAVLWLFSAFGGWGDRAFCDVAGVIEPGCSARMDTAAGYSLIPAMAALAIVLISLVLPRLRRNSDRLDLLLTVSGVLWIVAEVILFFLGYAAQP